MPSDMGIGFVLIQHRIRTHKSTMAELIARYTDMDVLEIQDNMPVKPNKVYVIPPIRT